MNPVELGQVVDVSLNLTAIPPQQPNLTDGFGHLLDKALNTNRIFQQAPLMMAEKPQMNDRAFFNSSDIMPDTVTGYLNNIDRSNIRITANDAPQNQNMYVNNGERVEGRSELQDMHSSLEESMKMLNDMNQRSALNNLMLTYAMANFTVLDTAVKSVSGAIDTLSRAQ